MDDGQAAEWKDKLKEYVKANDVEGTILISRGFERKG